MDARLQRAVGIRGALREAHFLLQPDSPAESGHWSRVAVRGAGCGGGRTPPSSWFLGSPSGSLFVSWGLR